VRAGVAQAEAVEAASARDGACTTVHLAGAPAVAPYPRARSVRVVPAAPLPGTSAQALARRTTARSMIMLIPHLIEAVG
jgi:hypothetical protein